MNSYFKKRADVLLCKIYSCFASLKKYYLYFKRVRFHQRTGNNKNTIECTDFLSGAVIFTA